MTAPTMAAWTCTNELGALSDAEVAYELRALAVDLPLPAIRLLHEAAKRIEDTGTYCPYCDEVGP